MLEAIQEIKSIELYQARIKNKVAAWFDRWDHIDLQTVETTRRGEDSSPEDQTLRREGELVREDHAED